jgi:hypothetical protein
VTQRARGMTHDGDWLAGSKEGLDQLDGVLVFGEIPHRAMAARVEDGVEVFLLDAVKANGLVESSSSQKPVFRPVLPSWSWDVITISAFMTLSFVAVINPTSAF